MNQIEQLIQEEKAKIVAETAMIHWKELEKFYAQGLLILVSDHLDLVEVAYAISQDEAAQVSEWLESGLLLRDFNSQAIAWEKMNAEVWSVVIRPWVLVQKTKN
jgi:hypothetical protein